MLTEHGCPIAPSTFYEERDANRFVAGLGARKLWLRLRSKGHDVARCTVDRLMREMGIEGLTRASGEYAPPSRTRPRRDRSTWSIGASPPHDRTSCGSPTSPAQPGDGMVYVAFVAFVLDVFSRRILGWRATNRG